MPGIMKGLVFGRFEYIVFDACENERFKQVNFIIRID